MSNLEKRPAHTAFSVPMLRGFLFIFFAFGALTVIAALWLAFMH